ncbi:MAG: MogA/MoaB family molybdenum cofactor biosynthesis protein [Synergistaceae bacterium]|nr:MogA/MoaB family molybdenum cofactor biosynthesis protein [Synergistaceae bacterium]
MNGEPCELSFRGAGSNSPRENGFEIIVAPDMDSSPGFLAVNSGETMLRLGENSHLCVVCPGFIGVSAPLEARRPIAAGVLTVSDKGSRGDRVDTSGPALVDLVTAIGSDVKKTAIVPDDRGEIAATLIEWIENDRLDLILTTGGTGLSERDVTPEALMDIHDRIVPGFGEIMRSHAMLYTPRGFLSRSVAVVRGHTLIIAFPGSERAVKQCFEVIAPALRHGVATLGGWDSECGGH